MFFFFFFFFFFLKIRKKRNYLQNVMNIENKFNNGLNIYIIPVCLFSKSK